MLGTQTILNSNYFFLDGVFHTYKTISPPHAKDTRLEFAMVQVLWNELAGQQFAGIFPQVSRTFYS